jgi:hypothetical protein
MKKRNIFLTLCVFFIFISTSSYSQISLIQEKKTPLAVQEECITNQRHKYLMENDPEYKAKREADEAFLKEFAKNPTIEKAVKTIPCVVHVMHTGQAISTIGAPTPNISDAQIQSAIDYMTKAFRAQAPYTGGVDTQIEFCLAKRDPSNNPSTGIVRYNASGVSGYSTLGCNTDAANGTVNEIALKAASKWDNTKYYNIWIVTEIDNNNGGSGTQGFAYFAGASATYDGAVMLYNSFGYDLNGTIGYNLKSYTNRNVTPTHEIGHALNLYHTFEGDGTGATCPTDAVCGTSGDCCPDTPRHKRSQSDCVVGTNSCTGGSSTLHIYNFMDYSSDDCQTRFTSDQNTLRMAPTLASGGSRYSLTQSSGCNSVFANDASIAAVIAPNGSYCKTTFSPIVTLSNNGSSTLTSVTITYNIDGSGSQTYNWTGSLASNTTVNVTLNSMTTTAGAHTFNAATSLPNGVADQYTTNDAIPAVAFNIAISAIPFTQNFEGSFAPTGWTNASADTPDGTLWGADGSKQWEKRSTTGNGVSTASAALNCFNYNSGSPGVDELISPAIDLNGTTVPELKFNVAHAYYGASNQERLRVLVSTDCGVTYTSIYDKTYTALATVGQSASSFSPTLAAHWRLETVSLAPYIGNSVVLKFEGTSGYGNNLYLDDINVSEPCNPPTVSVPPAASSVCAGSTVTISTTASGVATLTYQWQVSVNGGGAWSNVTNGGVYSNATTTALIITGATSGMNTYQYRCIVTNGCGTVTSTAATLTVTSTAAPTGAATQSFCGSGTVANLTATGTTIQWYASATGGTALLPSDVLVTATTYYATQTLLGCESATRFAVAVTVSGAPTAVPTGNATQTFCSAGTVANLVATGTAIQWYVAASGGTALLPSTSLINGTTYYASQTIGGCESTSRLAVVATVVPAVLPPTGSASQTFCAASSVSDLTATGSTINWYAASSGGSALLTSAALVNGTTYYATQTVSGCESTTRFAVAVTIPTQSAPTGSANQTYCIASTVADLVASGTAIQWYATPSAGSVLLTSDVLVDATTYYASQTISGCESTSRLAVLVTIGALPAPTGAASQTFCSSATIANLVATGSSIIWYSVPTGGTALASSVVLVDGTTYYASQSTTACESTDRLSVSVTVSPATSQPTGSASQNFCTASTIANLAATGTSVQWYAASTGGSALLGSTSLVSGTTYYASQTIGVCESATRLAVVATIGSAATPTGSTTQSFCSASTIANLVATGTAIQWYSAPSGGTALASSASIANGSTYYATQTAGGCESTSRLAVAVTVVVTSTPTGSTTQSFCTASTIANLTATGTSIQWYAAPSGGSALPTSTSLVNGTTYYASQTVSSCQSATRLAVSVSVGGAATPTGSASQTFCVSATVADLNATGTSIQWYSAATGGSALATSVSLVNGSTYYASQTLAGCPSTTRLAVLVSVTNVLAPTGSAVQSFCPSSTVANLAATGTGVLWYSTSTGGSSLATSTALSTGVTYYASQTVSGCVSSSRLAVTVTISSAPAAPTTSNASQTFCGGATVANLVAVGSGIQWYGVPSGGTPLASTFALSNATTYFATQFNGSCESVNRLAVSVVLNPTPTATLSALPTVCIFDSPLTLTQGSPVGGVYSGTNVSNGTFNPASLAFGQHQITYTFTNAYLCSAVAQGMITVDDCVGVNEIETSPFVVYPNPVSGILTISSKTDVIKSIDLYDHSGRLVASEKANGSDSEFKLNVDMFANGVYSIHVVSETKSVISKICIQN